MACRSGCSSQDHASYHDCLRSAGIQIDKHGLQNRDAEKDKDRRLSKYESLRSAGLQPKSTEWRHVRAAEETGGTRPTPINAS